MIVASILYVLHSDWWFWNDPQLVLGLPVGLFYHLIFCLVSAGVFFLFIHGEQRSRINPDRGK